MLLATFRETGCDTIFVSIFSIFLLLFFYDVWFYIIIVSAAQSCGSKIDVHTIFGINKYNQLLLLQVKRRRIAGRSATKATTGEAELEPIPRN